MVTLDRLTSSHPDVYIHDYLIEEDEMGDSSAQTRLLGYLEALLQALFGSTGPFVARNLTILHPAVQNAQNSVTPDISLFIGIPLTPDERRTLKSWDMRPSSPPQSRRRSTRSSQTRLRSLPSDHRDISDNAPIQRPCPPVMIEVSSESTWKTGDPPQRVIRMSLKDKVVLYGKMGVQLYLAYDPNEPPVWRGVRGRRLLGWRYDADGVPHLIEPDEREWLWCEELDSFVGEDHYLLRLYDRAGTQRLTGQEQELAGRQAAEAQARLEAQARQHAEELARVEAQARQHAEKQTARLLRLLREQGIDPGDAPLS